MIAQVLSMKKIQMKNNQLVQEKKAEPEANQEVPQNMTDQIEMNSNVVIKSQKSKEKSQSIRKNQRKKDEEGETVLMTARLRTSN